MKYEDFAETLNQKIFTDSKSKSKLIENIANHPQRYVGLFRSTKPKPKLFQNIFHSQESLFGNALEEIVKGYLKENGCTMIDSNISINEERKNIDLHFHKNNKVFVVEQKMRDDHDSTKKTGQVNDFKKKLREVIRMKGAEKTCGGIFFVDPSFIKNKKYYQSEILKIKNEYEGLDVFLWYGKDFLNYVTGEEDVWNELLLHLRKWRISIPDFPEVDFDASADNSFEYIKGISLTNFSKIFGNDDLQNEILPVLFPDNTVLKMLCAHFKNKGKKHEGICHKIEQYINKREKEVKN